MEKVLAMAALCLAMATPVFGQPVPCEPRAKVTELLSGRYQEAVRMEGLGAGGIYEVWAGKNGSWSITVTRPDGMTCLLASGEAFAAIPVGLPL
jgi:hypothetical protein